MKEKLFKKIFTLVGLVLLALVALNMNACSKDKNNNNGAYGGFGLGPGGVVPGGVLGNGIGVSSDGMLIMELTFAGQNGGQAGATGMLTVQGNSVGCAVLPGQYPLQTQVPGIYSNGDFSNIQLFTNLRDMYGAVTPATITLDRGWLQNQQDSYGRHMMYVNANIPGCPTVFN
jgi:hypothetical protein